MNRLQEVVKNRAVAIMAQGPSIEELDRRIDEFKDFDLCWVSINHFHLVEPIIEKINRKIEIIYITSPLRVHQNQKSIMNFLDRDDNNLWITTHMIKYRTDKTILDLDNPAHQKLNTLFAFIIFLIRFGVKNIFIFGADGGSMVNGNIYYNQDKFELDKTMEGDFNDKPNQLSNDSKVVNAIYKDVVSGHDSNVQILNCSINSQIDVFPKCTYDEAISELKGAVV